MTENKHRMIAVFILLVGAHAVLGDVCQTANFGAYKEQASECAYYGQSPDAIWRNRAELLHPHRMSDDPVYCCHYYARQFFQDQTLPNTEPGNDGIPEFANSFGPSVLSAICELTHLTRKCIEAASGCPNSWQYWFLHQDSFFAAADHVTCDEKGHVKENLKHLVNNEDAERKCLLENKHPLLSFLSDTSVARETIQTDFKDNLRTMNNVLANNWPLFALNSATAHPRCCPREAHENYATYWQTYYTCRLLDEGGSLNQVIPWYHVSQDYHVDDRDRCTVGAGGAVHIFEQCGDNDRVVTGCHLEETERRRRILYSNRYIQIFSKWGHVGRDGRGPVMISNLGVTFTDCHGCEIARYMFAEVEAVPKTFRDGSTSAVGSDGRRVWISETSPDRVGIQYDAAGISLMVGRWADGRPDHEFEPQPGVPNRFPIYFVLRLSKEVHMASKGQVKACLASSSAPEEIPIPDQCDLKNHFLDLACAHDCINLQPGNVGCETMTKAISDAVDLFGTMDVTMLDTAHQCPPPPRQPRKEGERDSGDMGGDRRGHMDGDDKKPERGDGMRDRR